MPPWYECEPWVDFMYPPLTELSLELGVAGDPGAVFGVLPPLPDPMIFFNPFEKLLNLEMKEG